MLIQLILFILLSPGLLLNIPGLSGSNNFFDLSLNGTMFFQTHQTSFLSILVHGLIFGILLMLVNRIQRFENIGFIGPDTQTRINYSSCHQYLTAGGQTLDQIQNKCDQCQFNPYMCSTSNFRQVPKIFS